MKVVVFGGSGFLGSHVADALSEKGYQVTIYDVRPSPYLQKTQQMILGDILDPRGVAAAVKGADIIYNFAGITDLNEARVNPVETIRHNILGNSIILDACRKKSIKRFLFASSIYVYSNSGSFYRSSKQACELIIEDYQKAYGIAFTILRYGSLYGPRADERNWVYSMLKQALTENRIDRKGDGEEIREYIHARDAARITVEVLDEQYSNQYVIISGNQAIKIKDLLIMIKEMLNNRIEIGYSAPSFEEHYEVTPYSFNPKIAKKIFGSPYLDLGQGLLDMLKRIHKEISAQRAI
jgi:UDP-glucose 4-epimerase